MYPDPQVAEYVTNHFIPVRVHVQRNSDEFKKLSAKYNTGAATAVIVDRDGKERFRIEGAMPPDQFLEQLKNGTTRAAA